MTTDDRTIDVYVKQLRGKIFVIHGTSPKEVDVARTLGASLATHGVPETESIAVDVKKLSHIVGTAGHIALVFNSMDNLIKKLRHNAEFTSHIGKMRQNDLVVVCKPTQISKSSPLIHFMQFNFDEDVRHLAVKCLTIFGAPKPVAGETDAVLWHDHPARVMLRRQENSSLGLSIITRQLHPSLSPLKRVTLIKDIQGSVHPLLKKYMHIQSINGVSLDNRDVSEAARIMQGAGEIEVQLMVRTSRRDVEKAERLRRQHGNQYVESPVEQREQFTLATKQPAVRMASTPKSTRSGDFGGRFMGSQSSNDAAVEDVFEQNHKKPTDLRCVTNNCITGVRQRGDTFDEILWEKEVKYDMLIGGASLGLSLTLVDFATNEDHNRGVMIKGFQSGCRTIKNLLQVNDLIHSIERTSLMDMTLQKASEVLEHSRGRNTEVTIGYYHMVGMNLEISQSRVKRLLSQQYMGRSDEGVSVEEQPHLPLTEAHKSSFIEKMLYEAKKQGLTIKLRHAKLLFCGPSKAGKSSFSRLLKNKVHEHQYTSTPVGYTEQLLVSGIVDVTGTDWKDLDSTLEIQELRKRFMDKLIKQQSASESLSSKTDEVNTDPSLDPCFDAILGDTLDESILVEMKMISDNDIADEDEPLLEHFSSDSEIWDILTLLDTGGQPEYINLLPAINNSTAIVFITFSISDGMKCLDKLVIAQHSDKDYGVHEQNYSNLHLLKCLLSSVEDSTLNESFYPKQLNIQKDQDSKIVVCFVGTHADKVKEQLETVVDALNEKINILVENIDDSKIKIWSDDCGRYIHPVNNTVPRDKQNDKSVLLAQNIRENTKKVLYNKPVFEIPLTWFILQLELRLLYETEKRECVPLSQVKEISDKIMRGNEMMNEWQIKEALKLFNLFGVLLYFDDKVGGMEDYVITNPQWLFCNLNKIVECKFSKKNQMRDAKAICKFKNEGVISKDLLYEIDLDIQIITMELFLNLLMYLRILAQIDSDSYFIPSVLATCHNNIDELKIFKKFRRPVVYTDTLTFSEVKSLLIEFAHGSIPRGLFGFLVVQLLQDNQDLKLDSASCYNKLCRFSDLISFFKKPCYHIMLRDTISYLEVQVWMEYDKPSIHRMVQEIITAALVKVLKKFHWKFEDLRYGFLCECTSGQHHLTRLSDTEPLPDVFPGDSCCKNDRGTSLNETHKIWFSQDICTSSITTGVTGHQNNSSNELYCDKKPDMRRLIKIVIPKIAADWEYFAYSMEYDINAVKTIEKDCQNSNYCCKKLFEDWLTSSHGTKPKTWGKLLERIKEVESLKGTAETIEEELKSSFS